MLHAKNAGSKRGRKSVSRKKVLRRFRRAVQMVMIAGYWLRRGVPPKLSQTENILFFLDIPAIKPELGAILRRRSFRDADEHSITSIARQVLQCSPRQRTDDQIQQLAHALRTFSKFSGYPPHVQMRICQHGWYARFDPSRIMVRHQQKAEVYYFLLSGIAISRAADNQADIGNSRRRQRAIFLRKGDTIGEKELLQNINRQATVVTKETVEVLGMDKQDFLDTFRMVMGDKLEFLPFLKTVGELLFFPLELLQAHYSASTVQNYRRGTVITRNSTDADWIYVIQKGCCQVFRDLRTHKREPISQKRCSVRLVLPDQEPEKSSASSSRLLPAILPPQNNSELTVPKQIGNARPRKSAGHRPRRSISDSHLPRLLPGGNLVAKRPDDSVTPHSDDEGLQTLIYEGGPVLILVSQGSECIMVAKQFLRDHLDSTTLNKLRTKVAPYPSASHVVTVTDEEKKPTKPVKSHRMPDRRPPWDDYYMYDNTMTVLPNFKQ